ncbi:MAG TPA: hypothetical protein VF605_04660 [Allosphingosinicella sp.]|jgi:hypothetical protein
MNSKDYHYHLERARAEMDCAYRATDHAAAAAHMKLSALHMDRIRIAKASAEPDYQVLQKAVGRGR